MFNIPNQTFQQKLRFSVGGWISTKAFFARHIFSAATLFLGMCGQPRPPVQLKIGVGATRCLLGGVTVKTHRGEALEEVASGASFFSTKKWWVGSSGWFTRDCQGHGTPLYGKRDPYYSHTIPISLGFFRDSYGSGMGIVWITGPVIGGPWKSHWWEGIVSNFICSWFAMGISNLPSIRKSIHGTGRFSYIYHTNQPNVGKYTSPMGLYGRCFHRFGGLFSFFCARWSFEANQLFRS